MAYLRNNKVLVIIIAILLLSNAAMLFFFLGCKKDKQQKKESPREYMIRTLKSEVGFTDSQIVQYEGLSDKHKETMKPLFEEIKVSKDSLYKLLKQDPPPDSLFNYYLSQIGERQENIEKRIFMHFNAIKQLCTADQRSKYDTVIQRVIKGMINPGKKSNSKDHK